MTGFLFASAALAQEATPAPTPCADAYREFQLHLSEQSAKLLAQQPNYVGSGVLLLAGIVLALIALTILVMLLRGNVQDRVAELLSESSPSGGAGKASISRLQMLIWNFVVAFAFLYILATRQDIYAAIAAIFQPEVLVLLGISNGTYVAGKLTGPSQADTPAAPEGTGDRGGQPQAPGESGPGPQGTH